MIDKETFVKRIGLIQNYNSELETLQVLIDKITDGYSVVTIGDYIINETMWMLSELIDPDDAIFIFDYINWWLYEDVDKVVYIEDKEIKVETPEELYDFLIHFYKKDHILDKDTHVYCTHCKHFAVIQQDDGPAPHCPFMDKCCLWDSEDSRPYSERPYYEEIKYD